jgi:hypothetical protein
MSYFLGLVLSFSQNLSGITLDDAPESTIQLCTFMLKISKVNKKGGVLDFDLWPFKDALTADCFFGLSFQWYDQHLPFPLLPPTLASLVFLEVVP